MFLPCLRRTAVGVLGLPLLLAMAACSDDGESSSTAPDGNGSSGTTVEEAEAMGVALSQLLAAGFQARLPETSDGSSTFDVTRDCPAGGTIRMRGSASESFVSSNGTTTIFLNSDAEISAQECTSILENDGRLLTITTPSSLVSTSVGEVVMEDYGEPTQRALEFEFTGESSGSFRWELEGASSGVCEIDMRMRMAFDADAYEISTEGTVCGQSVDVATEITPPGSGDTHDPSEPMFGALEFTPSFENIGTERSTDLTLRNVSSHELESILVGLDAINQTVQPENLCNTIAARSPLKKSPFPLAASGAGG